VTFDLIGFDADDTLWHNERSYRDGRARFAGLLAAAGVTLDDEALEERVNRAELANLPFYGYGVSSFALTLIETAIDLTDGRIAGSHLLEIIDLAKLMLTENVELFPDVSEMLVKLSAEYPLMLITKGDLLHQTSKIARSGLRDHFRYVEVVSHKTPEAYTAILDRHQIDPRRFLMVGNSLRSDVLPIVELGGWAVHVPAALSWSHEDVKDVPEHIKRRYVEVAALNELPEVVERLSRTSPSPPTGPVAGRRRPV
jgi:putative hydrolase of the HAD superfamily